MVIEVSLELGHLVLGFFLATRHPSLFSATPLVKSKSSPNELHSTSVNFNASSTLRTPSPATDLRGHLAYVHDSAEGLLILNTFAPVATSFTGVSDPIT